MKINNCRNIATLLNCHIFITFQWAKFDDDVVSLVSVNKKQKL